MQATVFGGVHVENNWEEVFLEPATLEWTDTRLLGIGVGPVWRRPGSSLSYGIELQLVGQFGDEDHLEINLPVTLRYDLPRVPALRSLALGIGPSYATRVPAIEVETRGDSEQLLVYWMLEAEFGPAAGRTSLFARLHHRSGVFGAVADTGASNALVLGLRRRW